MKKKYLLWLYCLSFCHISFAQKVAKDTVMEKEPIAVGEIGAAVAHDVKSGKAAYGFSLAVEATPIEDWLELEAGLTPTFASHFKATDVDLLLKKPWTFSSKLEFMLGIGADWSHSDDHNVVSNNLNGEFALDFMFWPYTHHRFGWYLEPEYDYGFGRVHEQSLGISGGLLIAIP